MHAKLPEVPDIGWFELEILFHLLDRERYGNELRMLLNDHLGEEAVSTGKLYPVLKKMEKAGYIRKLKKKTKDKIENEPGMTRRILTRGVDRVYFEITDVGREQLESAVNFSTYMLYYRSLKELHGKVKRYMDRSFESIDEDIQMGVIVPDTLEGVERARDMLPSLYPKQEIYLLMETKGSMKDPLRTEGLDFDINSFQSNFDDIPLKSDYLDLVFSFIYMKDIPDPDEFLGEVVRTIKPGGTLYLIDFVKEDSSVLTQILTSHLGYEGEREFRGEDPSKIRDILQKYISDITIKRFDELFVLSGIKE